MTNDEKAKAYDEAIKKAKEIKEKIVYSHLSTESCKAVSEYIDTIIPELRESEDERMMWEFNDWLCEEIECRKNDLRDEKDRRTLNMLCYVLTKVKEWLEKQKENPKNADSIPADCVSLAKCEDRDSKYGVFPEDVIVVARACEKLEAHGYSELAHALKNVNLYTKPIDYDHEMWKNCEANFEGGKKEVIDHPEKYGLQKEQKPISSYDIVPYIDDKIAELQDMWREEKVSFDWDDMKDMIEDVARHFYQKEPKPAEWSEEDDNMLESVMMWLDECEPQYVEKDKAWLESVKERLKSLRPSWKPSEEQMRCFDIALALSDETMDENLHNVLVQLREQLKKL